MATNIPKNSGTPTQIAKIVAGGYGYARYGLSVYGQGGPVNIQKGQGVLIWSVTTYPWLEVSPWTLDGGYLQPTNVTKNLAV